MRKLQQRKTITYYFLRDSLNPVGERNKNITLRIKLTVTCFCWVLGEGQEKTQTGIINHDGSTGLSC